MHVDGPDPIGTATEVCRRETGRQDRETTEGDDMDRLATGYGLIEGPVWDPHRGLLFSDVLHGGVFALGGDGEVATVFEHRRGIGGMSRHVSDAGLVVSGRDLSFKPFDGGDTIRLVGQHPEVGGAGFNDLTTDAVGRVYVGELAASPFGADRGRRSGALWMVDLDGVEHRVADDVVLTNGLGFSPDGRTLYHSDSERRSVMRYDVHDDGTLGPKELFVEVDAGAPDGLVVSEDGAVWVALAAGGAAVSVYEPSGTLRRRVEVPQPMVTSVCFGEADLRTLYVVTGSEGADTDRAGAVWAVEVDVPGLAVSPARIPLEP